MNDERSAGTGGVASWARMAGVLAPPLATPTDSEALPAWEAVCSAKDATRISAALAAAAPSWLRQDRMRLGAPAFLWDAFLASLPPDVFEVLLDNPSTVETALVTCWRAWRAGWIESEWQVN